MTQMGEGSEGGGGSPPPDPPPPEEGTGTVVVTVKAVSICWDTTDDGQPGPCSGALARATVGTETREETTGDDGIARITNVPAGLVNIEVRKNGYRVDTPPPWRNVAAGGTIDQDVQISLVRNNAAPAVCGRQHSTQPGACAALPNPPLPLIFWHPHFMIWLRETAWLILLVCFLVFLLIAIGDMADGKMDLPLGGFCLPAALFAATAYLTHIIFGMEAGITTILLAALSWVAMIVFTVLAATGGVSGLPINYVWFPSLCGMWGCFFVWLIPRFDVFEVEKQWGFIFLYAIVSVAFAVPIYLILVFVINPVMWADSALTGGLTVVVVIVSWACGLVASVAGHTIRNDANLSAAFVQHGELKKLPYAGFAFCVQGNRGWFSHFRGEELCYDFAVPEGSHVLAIEAGHVVQFRDHNVRSLYDPVPLPPSAGAPAPPALNSANHIYVEHRDGSVARYLHLVHDGVRSLNPMLVGSPADSLGPYHVHQGQALAKAGSTGMSRFPHIHLGLYAASSGEDGKGLAFGDVSVQRHGGRCYTFRPYTSDNPNRGPMAIRPP